MSSPRGHLWDDAHRSIEHGCARTELAGRTLLGTRLDRLKAGLTHANVVAIITSCDVLMLLPMTLVADDVTGPVAAFIPVKWSVSSDASTVRPLEPPLITNGKACFRWGVLTYAMADDGALSKATLRMGMVCAEIRVVRPFRGYGVTATGKELSTLSYFMLHRNRNRNRNRSQRLLCSIHRSRGLACVDVGTVADGVARCIHSTQITRGSGIGRQLELCRQVYRR